jgi:Bacterial Ig-like domain (group 2)
MSIRRLFVVLAALSLMGPGCGDSSDSGSRGGTQMSGFLTINAPSDVIKCGACQPFTATYTKGGTPQTVTPTWRTDNTAVATIDAAGQLTPIAHGDVTVIAEYQEARASKLVHVVNDYGASWYGNYLVTRCQATGGFDEAGWCDEDATVAVGKTLPVALELVQDRDTVTGTLWLGAVNGSFTGSVATGGNLTGEAKLSYMYDGGVMDAFVSPFSVMREGDRIAQGTFTVVSTAAGVPGNCTFEARIMGLDKAPSGRASMPRVQGMPRTLRDVLRLLQQR